MNCDIYFYNRGTYRNISSYDQLVHVFVYPPDGNINMISILDTIRQDHIDSTNDKPLVIQIFTNGLPFKTNVKDDTQTLSHWLKYNKFKNKIYYSIILCTNDIIIEKYYSILINKSYSYFSNSDFIAVTTDYMNESTKMQEIYQNNNNNRNKYQYTVGDYIIKILIGIIDPSIHKIDSNNKKKYEYCIIQ